MPSTLKRESSFTNIYDRRPTKKNTYGCILFGVVDHPALLQHTTAHTLRMFHRLYNTLQWNEVGTNRKTVYQSIHALMRDTYRRRKIIQTNPASCFASGSSILILLFCCSLHSISTSVIDMPSVESAYYKKKEYQKNVSYYKLKSVK